MAWSPRRTTLHRLTLKEIEKDEIGPPEGSILLRREIFYEGSCQCYRDEAITREAVDTTLETYNVLYEDNRTKEGLVSIIVAPILPALQGSTHPQCMIELVKSFIAGLIAKDNEARIS